jgi:hypothetical protein
MPMHTMHTLTRVTKPLQDTLYRTYQYSLHSIHTSPVCVTNQKGTSYYTSDAHGT